MEECAGFVARLTPFKDKPEKQSTQIDTSVLSPCSGESLPSTMTTMDYQIDPMTAEPTSMEELKSLVDALREHSVAIERDRAQLALLVGETNSKNSSLREKVANLSEKLETARQEKSALEAITTKIEDLMWEQGAEHQSEMTQMQAAYDQMILIKVKEAREDGIKLGIAQQSGLPVVEDAEEKPESPKGILAELFSFGSGSNTSGELKELQEKLEALQAESDDKQEEIQGFMGDRQYYESQIAQGKGELAAVQLKLREALEENTELREGASHKQLEKAVKEGERTLSYVKKHMFHLFKSCGQERVREYMKEVFAGNWKSPPPMALTQNAGASVTDDKLLRRDLVALEKRCDTLEAEKVERDDDIRGLEKELRYAEKELAKERQRVRKAEELLMSMSTQKEKKKSFWKKLTN